MKRNEQKSAQQIKLGTLTSYIGIAISIVTGLLYTPWMIRQIGQSDYALYTLATSLITMFTIDFGMSAAVSRFVAKYNAEGKTEETNNFLGLVYKLYSAVSAIVFVALLVVFFFIDQIYASLSPAELERFKVVYLIAGCYSVVSFPFVTFNGILNAYERFVELKVCDLVNKVLTVLLIAGTLILGGNVYTLVAVNAIVGLATIVVKFFIIRKNTDIKVNFRYFSKGKLKEIFGYSLWSTAGSVAHTYLINITPSILAMVANSVEVAVFGFAHSIGTYVYMLAMGVDGFFLPKVSRMVADHNKPDDFLNLMVQVGRFQLYIIGLITVGFLVVGRDFVLLLMGEQYESAYYCVIFYLIQSIICHPQQIADTMVTAMNRVKERALISIAAAVVNVGLSYIISRYWGAVGAYISICMAILVRTLFMNILYKKKLKLKVGRFFLRCHLALLPAFAVAFVLSFFATSWLGNGSWMKLVAKVLIVCVMYAISAFFFGTNKEEKSLIQDVLHIRKK